MNQPETSTVIAIATIATLVIVADIVVRMFILPARKQKFILDLLDHLVGPSADVEASPLCGATAITPADLSECLLRLFEKSGTSREILNTLANSKGLTQKELSIDLNRRLAGRGNPALPPVVARRIAVNLLHAGLLTVEHGRLRSTDLGKSLNMLVQQRKGAALASAV